MSSFGDELRAVLAKKKEQLFVAQMQEERRLHAAKKIIDDTRNAVARLVREVFAPLLEEFAAVMEAAGVFCGRVVEEDDGSEIRDERSSPPSQSLIPHPSSLICRLRATGAAPQSPHYEIRIACLPSNDGRIDAALECLDATAAEFDANGGEGKALSLLKLPAEATKKTFRAAGINHDTARQWAAALLKKCAEACMEANGGKRDLSHG